MAELVDALDSGSSRGNSVDVRVILAAMIYLIAGGEIRDYNFLAEQLKGKTAVIAIDGGLAHCDAIGVTPEMIVGDFDSVSPELLNKYAHVPTKRFSVEKDETDLEIGLRLAFERNPEKCIVLGALRERTDHSLYNLHLLSRYPMKVYIETELETLFVITGSASIATFPRQTLSLVPLAEPATGITTQGLKWELNNAEINKNFMSISNIALGSSFEITVESGDILCSLNKLNS